MTHLDIDLLLSLEPRDVRNLFREHSAVSDILVISLLSRVKKILTAEPNVLFLPSPITICGDIHGQLFDLFNLFDTHGDPPLVRYLFLGDYIDRGHQSVLTFLYLSYLKIKYPDSFFLLRGNHETRIVNQLYGFHVEITSTYGYSSLFDVFNCVFDVLPLCAIVEKSWFCVHGGLSPEIVSYRRIHTVRREICCNSGPSLITGLLWSDPDEEVTEWKDSPRGVGNLFGRPQVEHFLENNRLRGIVRSHQMVAEGFRWFFDKKLALVWSAPNYAYKDNNLATVMQISGLEVEFKPFEADQRSPDIPQLGAIMEYFA
jgi:diadenosine tetraphosphatase ApaH/serine/threonine PP2A family protein phosphatase